MAPQKQIRPRCVPSGGCFCWEPGLASRACLGLAPPLPLPRSLASTQAGHDLALPGEQGGACAKLLESLAAKAEVIPPSGASGCQWWLPANPPPPPPVCTAVNFLMARGYRFSFEPLRHRPLSPLTPAPDSCSPRGSPDTPGPAGSSAARCLPSPRKGSDELRVAKEPPKTRRCAGTSVALGLLSAKEDAGRPRGSPGSWGEPRPRGRGSCLPAPTRALGVAPSPLGDNLAHTGACPWPYHDRRGCASVAGHGTTIPALGLILLPRWQPGSYLQSCQLSPPP